MAVTEDISTSGPISGQFLTETDNTDVQEELPGKGFNALVKVKRQGRWFVLKGLKPEYRDQAVYLQLLRKEYELMVQLDHPNIVKAYAKEVNATLGPCIVMEYIDGIRLDEFLAANPSAEARRKVAGQLADALSYIHSKQMLHRDLKPSNIMVTRNGENAKIIDFGLSDADDYAILKQSVGTVGYMAPEQRSSGETIDHRTDIYAFGLILRKLYPHRYAAVAAKCMRKDRSRRYDSMDAVKIAMLRSDRLRQALPTLCMAAVLVIAAAVMLRRPSVQQPAFLQPDIETPDQLAYLKKAFWEITPPVQEIMSEAETGDTYKEVLLARLSGLQLALKAKCNEMSKLYEEGSADQLIFISRFNKEQDNRAQIALKVIMKQCPSFEEEFKKGHIGKRACDSLRWVVAPGLPTVAVTDISDSEAYAGVQLADDSFAGGAVTGLCWGPCRNPGLEGHHATSAGSDGRIRMDGLVPATTYFARGFVQTAAGVFYGNEVSFTTPEGEFPVPEGAASGLFSSSEGRQVYFSKGNLQYQASTGTWRFAPQQYAFTGNANTKLSPTWDGWADLFGWATSGYDHGAEDFQPWSGNADTKTDVRHYAYGRPDGNLYDQDGRADWGYNPIAGAGGREGLWRTPRVSELVYILFNRNTASGVRFAKAQVAGVNGLILLPDNWRVALYPLNSVNDIDCAMEVNTVTADDWASRLEPAGAVFLPAAGARTVSGVFTSLGVYYTSDAAATDAWHIVFDEIGLAVDARGHRGDGLSVRLVRDWSDLSK